MAVTLTNLQVSLHSFSRTDQKQRIRPSLRRNLAGRDGLSFPGSWRPLSCSALRSEEGEDSNGVENTKGDGSMRTKKRKGPLYSLKSAMVRVLGSEMTVQVQYNKAVEKAEDIFFSVTTQVGRYLLTMMSSGVILAIGFQLSGGDGQMNTLIWYSWLGGIIIGTMIGANMVLEEHSKAGPRNVVITGSTRGLGKALAREFLLSGDRVVIASRSPESVYMTVEELRDNLKEGKEVAGKKGATKFTHAKVVGIACDVCKPDEVRKLANFAIGELGHIDIWINNAGTNKGFRPLLQFTDEDINQIVSTNLVGSLICTREAMHVMQSQGKVGHIFNMDGAGSGGSSTPLTVVGSTVKNKQMPDIICELPETVARMLVPRMRVVKGSGRAINYLTPPRILLALVTAWVRRGRWFDDQGRALYGLTLSCGRGLSGQD